MATGQPGRGPVGRAGPLPGEALQDLLQGPATLDAWSHRWSKIEVEETGKRALLGLSDAGAHATQLCDACYSAHLLGHWVRERKAITLEGAVWRLTGHPAAAFRIAGRGLMREGRFADLVAFDPEAIGTTPVERVHDQPGGAARLVVRSTGVEHMRVNGVATRVAGEDVPQAASGRLLRS